MMMRNLGRGEPLGSPSGKAISKMISLYVDISIEIKNCAHGSSAPMLILQSRDIKLD